MTHDGRSADTPPLTIVLLCGPSASGKSFLAERLMAVEYDVRTGKADSIYRRALQAAGVPPVKDKPYRILQESVKLRTEGDYPPEVVAGFFSEYESLVYTEIAEARRLGVSLVLEGLTFRYADEVRRVVSAARSQTDDDFVAVRVQVKPPFDRWNENRTTKGGKRGGAGAPLADQDTYDDRMAVPEPLRGVRDYVVEGGADLRDLMDHVVNLPRHEGDERFRLGPISTLGPSSTADKLETVDQRDVDGKRVLDFCCASGVVALALKDRGARRVIAVDKDPRKHCKGLELRKVLLRHSDVDARVGFRLGDGFDVLPSVGRVNTVVFFGAIHCFADYAATLRALAKVATEVIYVEFTFSAGDSGATEAEEEIKPCVRPDGDTIYMGTRAAVDRVIGDAIPGWVVEAQTSISAHGGESGTDRQVWRIRRKRARVAA